MNIGSLFSGYGGLDMAVAEVTGAALAWYSEIEPAACRVLSAHYPDVPNLGDITAIEWADVPAVDIVTGGYPCQPFSHAGHRKGAKDERHLWPHVADALSALRPGFVVLENVAGHLSLGFADVLGDLARLGYDAQWGIVRASDAGAPHQRKRLFIVAYTEGWRWGTRPRPAEVAARRVLAGVGDRSVSPADSTRERLQRQDLSEAAVEFKGRPEPVADDDCEGASADPCGERHGSRQGPASLADLGESAEGRRWTPSATWQESGTGSAETAADSDIAGSQAWDHTGPDSQRLRLKSVGPAAPTTNWGRYEPAIRRWESLTRPAPLPTIEHQGRPRLNPQFVEWMMGLPAGHVTGHGLSNAQALKMLGNGVVPQQAHLALSLLLNYPKPIGQHT